MSAENIECPKCGSVVPVADECARCGVIFAKIATASPVASQAASAPASPVPPAPGASKTRFERVLPIEEPHETKKPRRLEPYLGLALVLALGALALGQWFDAEVEEIGASAVAPVERLPDAKARRPAGGAVALNGESEVVSPVSPGSETPPQSARRVEPPGSSPPDAENRRAPRVAAPVYEPEPAPRPQITLTPDSRWFEGAQGFESGWARAKKTKQPVLVYFYTEWCGYCRQLERNLFSQGEVQDFTRYLVKIKINPERGANERLVADYYGVNGYPSVFVHRAGPGSPKKVRGMSKQGGEWKLMQPRAYASVLADAAVGR